MRCVVPNCNNDSNFVSSHGITFHKFPMRPSRRAAWLTALRKEDWQPPESSAVCSDHFLPQDLTASGAGRTLRQGAVPVINATQNSSESIKFIEDDSATHKCDEETLHGTADTYPKFQVVNIKLEHVEQESMLPEETSSTQHTEERIIPDTDPVAKVFVEDKTVHTTDMPQYVSIKIEKDMYYDGRSPDRSMECLPGTEDSLVKHIKTEPDERHDGFASNVVYLRSLYPQVDVDVKVETVETPVNDETDVPNEEVVRDDSPASGRHSSHARQARREGKGTNATPKRSRELRTCDLCPFETRSEATLSSHVKAHAARRSFTCHSCHYRTVYEHHLKYHMRKHSGEKPHTCDVCKKTFSLIGTLNRHLRNIHRRIVSGGKMYTCQICKKEFRQKCTLKKHLVRVHSIGKPYSCNICDKAFSHKENRENHLKTHAGERPYLCNICMKRFTQKSILKTHLRTHSGEKPFSCSICEKAFSQKDKLNNHLRIHSGEKPFTCDICKKAFTQQSSLHTHLKTHTGEKPHTCVICKKAFSQNCKLKNHMRTHSGERPYSCDVCKKSFSEKGNLQKHTKLHLDANVKSKSKA